MDSREKLIELIKNAKAAMRSENLSCDLARNGFVADFLIANGVIVPPCKVGDTVWEHEWSGDSFIEPMEGYVVPSKVQHFGLFTDNDMHYLEHIGKTVFLTREEAEEALKKGTT